MNAKNSNVTAEMLPAYDFSGQQGVRGKYYRAYQEGHTIKVHQEDGSIVTHCVTAFFDHRLKQEAEEQHETGKPPCCRSKG
jgi:hypothetical protein